MSRCPDVDKHTQLSVTAVDAAKEPGEGQTLASVFLVLWEEGGGRTVRWWEIPSKLGSSLEGGVGHRLRWEVAVEGGCRQERSVSWSLLSYDLSACPWEMSVAGLLPGALLLLIGL